MWDWGYVGDVGDFVVVSIQSVNGGFVVWVWVFDVDVQVFQIVFQGSLVGMFGCYLGSEWGVFM